MRPISEADIIKSLAQDNPWWREGAKGWVEDVPQPRRGFFKNFKSLALNWELPRSTILMGPRRVGKTVMLRQLIIDALAEGMPQRDIFYVSLDTPLYSGRPLQELLDLFDAAQPGESRRRRLVIFDEVQYLKDWEVHLKVLTDRYPHTRFIASGSAAAALRMKSQESGAGRFTDFLLPPLTFAEFLHLSGRESHVHAIYNSEGNITGITNYSIDDLNDLFLSYINHGGFPEAIFNESVRRNVGRFVGRDIIDKVLLRDLPSLYGVLDVQELYRLFNYLAYNTGGEVNIDALSKDSGVTKNTLTRYLSYLEAAYLIIIVKRIDGSGKKFQRQNCFKVYLTNPSIRAALFGPVDPDDEAMGALVETAIFSQSLHGGAEQDSASYGWSQIRNIFFARWKEGRVDHEVDWVSVNPLNSRPMMAMEIKWSDRFFENPGKLIGLLSFARKIDGEINIYATTRSKFGASDVDGHKIEHLPSSFACYGQGMWNLVAASTRNDGVRHVW